MGTDKSYKAYNKKKEAARAAGKGSFTPYVPVSFDRILVAVWSDLRVLQGAEVREMLAKRLVLLFDGKRIEC